jgi:hypothetical protein
VNIKVMPVSATLNIFAMRFIWPISGNRAISHVGGVPRALKIEIDYPSLVTVSWN